MDWLSSTQLLEPLEELTETLDSNEDVDIYTDFFIKKNFS